MLNTIRFIFTKTYDVLKIKKDNYFFVHRKSQKKTQREMFFTLMADTNPVNTWKDLKTIF